MPATNAANRMHLIRKRRGIDSAYDQLNDAQAQDTKTTVRRLHKRTEDQISEEQEEQKKLEDDIIADHNKNNLDDFKKYVQK